MKGHMVLREIAPRIKSNLLEILFSNRYSNFFAYKVLKKLLHTHGYYSMEWHVNVNCSSTTYSHFCIKYLAKNLKKRKLSRKPHKNKEILSLKTSKTENMLKMTHVRSKKQNVKKWKGTWFWVTLIPESRVIC